MRKTKLHIVKGRRIAGELFQVGSDAWFQWLKHPDHKSFRYASDQTCDRSNLPDLTVRNRTGDYWYAYRVWDGNQMTFYLGKTLDVDYEKLQLAACELRDYEEYERNKKLRSQLKKNVQDECTRISQTPEKCTSEDLYNSQQAAELREENTSLLNQVAALQAENASLQNQVTELKEENVQLKDQVAALTAQLAATEQRLDEFYKCYAELLAALYPLIFKIKKGWSGYKKNSASKLINELLNLPEAKMLKVEEEPIEKSHQGEAHPDS